MPAVVIIPARYGSTRFPGKPLALISGKPLIQRVYENSAKSKSAGDVIVATDSKKILDAVRGFGGRAVMTSKSHKSGTDRVAEAALNLDYDIIVNVQGDEPLIKPAMIDAVIGLLKDARASIGTLARRIDNPADALDPNVVKVAFSAEGFALYFSRSPIPYYREKWKTPGAIGKSGGYKAGVRLYKHIGIYGYRKDALLGLSAMKPSALERIEMLEQLRALEVGMKIKVGVTTHDTVGVDAPGDIRKAERWLSSSS